MENYSTFVGTIANIYLAEKKVGIANWLIEGKKQYAFARQLPHTETYIYRLNTHSQTSIGRSSWELEYGYGPLQIYFKKDC